MHTIGFIILLHMTTLTIYDGVYYGDSGTPAIYKTYDECREAVMLPGVAFMVDPKTSGVVHCVKAVRVVIRGKEVIIEVPDARDQA